MNEEEKLTDMERFLMGDRDVFGSPQQQAPAPPIRTETTVRNAEELQERLYKDRPQLDPRNQAPPEPVIRQEVKAIPKQYERTPRQETADEEYYRRVSVTRGHRYIRDEINLRDDAELVLAKDRWFREDNREIIENSFEYKHPFLMIILPLLAIPVGIVALFIFLVSQL